MRSVVHVAAPRKRPVDEGSAADYLPARLTLPQLREAAAGCRACPLWRRGTQTVFGAGPSKAGVVFVGEQPGDLEDRAGEPFVGPAGKLLDRCLVEAGIDRAVVYVTNVVKHFKWEPRGKKRIHEKPNGREIAACRPWLEAELAVVKPKVVVCLGATAAQAILGKSFKVTERRGEAVTVPGIGLVVATVHPSSVLRAPGDEQRRSQRAAFVDDLRRIARLLGPPPAAPRPRRRG